MPAPKSSSAIRQPARLSRLTKRETCARLRTATVSVTNTGAKPMTIYARDGEKVDRTAMVPGDLVFFGRRGKRVDHVGIYIGEGRFLHAPRTGRDVTVSQLDTGYWSGRFLQARRVAGLGRES